MTAAATKYARSGEVHVAYRCHGGRDLDLVIVHGMLSHLDLQWEHPPYRRMIERLAIFARVIDFDRRGAGLSDPVLDVPTLEERMDDLRAVMDDAGSDRAVLFGLSEGAPMAILFAATYPERVHSLVLYGAMARSTADHDYPWAAPADALIEANRRFVVPHWGEGTTVETFAPSVADDPAAREFFARLERQAASPAMAHAVFRMFLDTDVRHALPAISAPTLVLHRRGDRAVSVHAGRWLADHVDGARFVELPGIDHNFFFDDDTTLLDEMEEFLTGARVGQEPDRVLSTVMFTDIVSSTETAAVLGDRRWADLLERHDAAVRHQIDRFQGRTVKHTGDGFLATFDGPIRAIRCGLAIRGAARELGLRLKVGIHSGTCEIRGDDIGGIAVHTAARIGELAEPEEVLVSRTVKDLVAGAGLEFDDRGTHQLKGVPDTWQLYRVRD